MYERPRPPKFGKDPPLWKTATSCFLKIVKEVRPRIDALSSSDVFVIFRLLCDADAAREVLSSEHVESILRQVIDVYRGGNLSDWYAYTH